MKTTILIITLFFSLNIFGLDLNKHPIYAQILKNRPRIDKKYAFKLSNIIYKYSVIYKIPKKIFTAILMQESAYKLEAMGCHLGFRKLSDEELESYRSKCIHELLTGTNELTYLDHCSSKIPKLKEDRICTDFGISQVYYKTAQRYNFDIAKLTEDLEYSVKAGAIVLRDFMRMYSKKEVYWWTRYNASSKDKRRIYRGLVERYF